MVAAIAVVGLLVVAYGVGWCIESVVTSLLFRTARPRAIQRRQAEREAQLRGDAVRIKRLLDAQAFAAHQQMLRAAQEHSTDQQ